jgi:hypothetical protein
VVEGHRPHLARSDLGLVEERVVRPDLDAERSGGFCAVQPLLRTNLSRSARPCAMPSTVSPRPCNPMYATGSVPPLHPLSCAPEKTATARKTVGREQASEKLIPPP